jgi:hypothetical protein
MNNPPAVMDPTGEWSRRVNSHRKRIASASLGFGAVACRTRVGGNTREQTFPAVWRHYGAPDIAPKPLCKPEVIGSIPIRSMADLQALLSEVARGATKSQALRRGASSSAGKSSASASATCPPTASPTPTSAASKQTSAGQASRRYDCLHRSSAFPCTGSKPAHPIPAKNSHNLSSLTAASRSQHAPQHSRAASAGGHQPGLVPLARDDVRTLTGARGVQCAAVGRTDRRLRSA